MTQPLRVFDRQVVHGYQHPVLLGLIGGPDVVRILSGFYPESAE